MVEEKEYSGMMAQFIEIQRKYPKAVVLTEVGKFFEIWEFDDLKIGHAVRASQIIDITLTRRSKKDLSSPRMAGFPSMSAEYYIKKLVDEGETVVVVKQSVSGKKSDQNKNVTRYIERIISPGTSIYQGIDNRPHYFASVYNQENSCGVCLIDLSTGEVRISEMSKDDAKVFIENNNPLEILFCQDEEFIHKKDKQIFHHVKEAISRQASAGVVLAKIYDIDNPSSNNAVVLSKIGIELWPMASLALVNLLNFLVEYNPLLLKKISKPSVEHMTDSLFLSKNGFLSLDIFDSPLEKDESKTVYGALNRCKTAMGRRLLRKWIQHPLINLSEINDRHDRVQAFIDKKDFLEELKEVYDISRLTRRLALRSLLPHEILSFNNSLTTSQSVLKKFNIKDETSKKVITYVKNNIELSKVEGLGNEDYSFFKGSLESKVLEERVEWQEAKKKLDKRTEEISELLETDKLRISFNKESIQLTGPKSLHTKCKENNISFKVKASEVQIDDAKWEELATKEFYLKRKFVIKCEKEWCQFQTILVEKFGEELLEFANKVGETDVLSNFAQISVERNYSRAIVHDLEKPSINIKAMRHPVVELSKELTESFVSNDLLLDSEKNLMVIYGANSAGKSTILKSLAVNILMNQIGCFVPANKGSELSIFDCIMTRMTTYDSLSEGLSTFTMEMIELQSALGKHKERSLFLFDEIGRGTSVDDGEAIAFATLEFLKPDQTNSITLFSTHYHSLYDNVKGFKNIIVKHMAGGVENGVLSFSRTLKDGPGEGSYGIMVAKSCGIPESIVRVAENYNKQNKKLIVSRYNSSVQGTLCEFCNKEQAQETHHLIEQHQGKVEKVEMHGTIKDIHDKGNLVLLCSTCHTKITNEKIKISKRKIIGKGAKDFKLVIEEVSQNES